MAQGDLGTVKLLDQVVQARLPMEVEDPTGRYCLPGAGEHAASLARCATRYVAEETVARYCASLVQTDAGMLVGDNDFLRVPAPELWLEWQALPLQDEMSGARTGLLIEADASGRRGAVTTFWEQREGEPVVAQMTVQFDLDDAALHETAPTGAFMVRADEHPLALHLMFFLRPEWCRYFDRQQSDAVLTAAAAIAANILPGLEMLFTFSALLAERTCLTERAIDLSRLNRQRARRGGPALLDHVEVRLDLAMESSRAVAGKGIGREAARLHAVRGHLVHRGDRTFWRRSHLRGDATRTGFTRTVHVTRKAG